MPVTSLEEGRVPLSLHPTRSPAAKAPFAARKTEEEAREARRVEQARLDAAAAAEREEALLAIRRAGRKKKKRKGH